MTSTSGSLAVLENVGLARVRCNQWLAEIAEP
jgi:hypothetical protein